MRFHGTALALCLASCQGPDRWSVSTGLGDGSFDTLKAGDRDVDSQWVEVGVSGPLGFAQEPRRRCETPTTQILTSAPTAQPEPSGDIPWEELLLLLVGAGGWEGSKHGYRKVKERRSKRARQE